MQVTPPTTAGTIDTSADPTLPNLPGQTLSQQDFLKLLVTQLSSQDPLNPQTDTSFIAQMAQFTSLEQTQTMAADLAKLYDLQAITQANALLGRTVEVPGDAHTTFKGVVTAVRMVQGKPQLVINGRNFDPATVLSVSGTVSRTRIQK